MQELVTILSIILGVIVLTAWAMWLFLRPSGDSKVDEFADKSARDGMTLAMIENNQLKNTVTRLERELKVLMSARYGQSAGEKKAVGERKSEIKGESGKEESGKVKGERLLAKKEVGAGESLVAGASRGEVSALGKEQKIRHEVRPSEELKAKWRSADEMGTIKDQRSLLRGDSKAEGSPEEKGRMKEELQAIGERLKVKGDGLKGKGERQKVKGVKRKAKAKAKSDALRKSARVKANEEKLITAADLISKKEAGVGAIAVAGASRGEGITAEERLKVKDEGRKTKDEGLNPKPPELIQSSDGPALSESQRLTDKKEKKKIAAYLASVAETTERQMKEVEALEETPELVQEAIQYPDQDLKKIKGVGLHLEGKLKKAGIRSYQQIAELSDEDVQRVAKEIGYFPRRIKRDEWVEQAKALFR